MTDLSKVPDLELRQKIKPMAERLAALQAAVDKKLDELREQNEADLLPLKQQAADAEDEIDKLLGEDRWFEGICDKTGLPIFSDDETEEIRVLACVA